MCVWRCGGVCRRCVGVGVRCVWRCVGTVYGAMALGVRVQALCVRVYVVL